MISKKLLLRLLTVSILASISSGKKCYAPVVCNKDEYAETGWMEVYPPCGSKTNEVDSQPSNTAGQKSKNNEDKQMGVIADSKMAALEKDIEAQRTVTDATNATLYDQQRAIKSLNRSLQFLKEEFEAKLNKLQEGACKNGKDISDIQTSISSNDDDSMTTPPNEKSTPAYFATTASKECKDDDIYYGDYCFWFDATRRDFAASELLCQSRNSTVGYLLDEGHYNSLMNHLRTAIPSGQSWWAFWLGLRQDLSTTIITVISTGLTPPFQKWITGWIEPSRGASETHFILRVEKDALSNSNGMGNINPAVARGVICQYKSL